MIKVSVNGGVPDAELHDTPEGNGPFALLQDSVTGSAGPLTRLTVIVIEPELPRATEMPPRFEEPSEFDKRKSKLTGLPKFAVTVPAPYTVTVAAGHIAHEQDKPLLQLHPPNGALLASLAEIACVQPGTQLKT